MALNVAGLVSGLAAVSVTGVKTKMAEAPRRVSDAMLPISYPRVPSVVRSVGTIGGALDLDRVTVEMVILVRSMMVSTQAGNFAAVTALMDAINTAYSAQANTLQLDLWAIEETQDSIDGAPYWALVVRVEASG